MLEITEREEQGIVIVHPVGNLDTLTARTFEACLDRLISSNNGPLLVSLEDINYVSSFGLRSILIAAKKLAPFGRPFVLFSPNGSVMDVLKVSGFLNIITVAGTRSEALEIATAGRQASS